MSESKQTETSKTGKMSDDRLAMLLDFGKWIIVAIVLIVVLPQMKGCCNCAEQAKGKRSATQSTEKTDDAKPQVVDDLEEIPINGKGVYKTPSGKKRIINHKPASPDEDQDASSSIGNGKNYMLASLSEVLVIPKSDNKLCDAEGCPDHCDFDGVKRAEAKTSISRGKKVTYKNVKDFLARFVSKHLDVDMPAKVKGSNGRIDIEDFNATITKAWLFCFAKESDEDYHLVIGSKRDINDTSNRFIIVEIGGLPKSGADRAKLFEAQNDFFKIVGEPVCETGYYWFDDGNDPVPITVSGSIYWDAEHWNSKKGTTGTHGPGELRDRLTTVWEMHPVTAIKELQ